VRRLLLRLRRGFESLAKPLRGFPEAKRKNLAASGVMCCYRSQRISSTNVSAARY
jgi:hypothetical protein